MVQAAGFEPTSERFSDNQNSSAYLVGYVGFKPTEYDFTDQLPQPTVYPLLSYFVLLVLFAKYEHVIEFE